MDDEAKLATRSHALLISKVQEDLRAQCRGKSGDEIDRIWREHCGNGSLMEAYASSMGFLANFGWNSWLERCTDQSRVAWCRNVYQGFFITDRECWEQTISARDAKLAKFHGDQSSTKSSQTCLENRDKIRLLDVGSCYNPFQGFEDTETFAIDLAPAVSSGVAKCDFLNVDIKDCDGSPWILEDPLADPSVVRRIGPSQFDVVVLSLVLSYLPTPEFRLVCCRNAFTILKPNGLLLVVTPDSKRSGKNDSMVKAWKIALSLVGFHRLVHDKLTHVHCMAFRKSAVPVLERIEGERLLRKFRSSSLFPQEIVEPCLENLMFIPQDFRQADSPDNEVIGDEEALNLTGEEKVAGFTELPFLD